MAKYTLFAKGGNVKGQKKLKDGNYASHKVSLEQDGKSKKNFVAYVNEGDDRTANFYDMTGKFVMDMKVSDGGKLVSEGKMKKIMDYEVPKENVKVRNVSLKDMNYSELRQYIQDKYIDEIKNAEFYFNIYEIGDLIEFVDDSIRDQHKKIFEENADYLESNLEKKTGLKVDGWELQDEEGNELKEVDSGNTYNWSYLGGADFNWRTYESSDGEKYYLMALIHMGGDIRGNYGDAFIFEGDSKDEVFEKFYSLLRGGGHVYLQFKDGSSVSFDSQQDSDVWYFEQHERNDEPVTGLAKKYLEDFESFGSWDGDEFLERTIEEFHQGKKVHSYERGGTFEVGRFYKNKEGNVYRYLGSKYFMGQDGQYKKLEVDDFYRDGGIMAKGGQLNIHDKDFKGDFTIEWDVKGLGSKANISEEDFEYEYETGAFSNSYAQKCFDEIKSKVKPKSWSIKDWSFAGRSNGWFVLICDGNEDYPVSGYGDDVTDSQMDKMNSIVDKYKKNYTKELEEFYSKEKKEDGGKMARGGVLSHGFKTGDKILNDYLGYAIVKNTDGVSVVNPNSGSRFVISLDDSKMGGARKMIKMSEKQQIDAAIDYIDTLEPLND
jgi:hypothetical protein